MHSNAAAVYLAYNTAENAHDLDLLESLVSDDLLVFVNGRAAVGSAAEDRAAMQRLFTAYPDYRRAIDEILDTGPRATVRWRMLGTASSPAEPGLDIPGCSIVTARAGRLAQAYLYYDGAALDRVLSGTGG